MIIITNDKNKKAILDSYCEGHSWLWRKFFGFRDKYRHYKISEKDFEKLREIYKNYYNPS